MSNLLLTFRYCVFAIFIISNAVISSVAVWNLSLAQSIGYNFQVTIYLIFLGAFGLLCIFPLIFIDLLRKNPLTSRIWFECIWVTLFWSMELAGAASITAIIPSVLCTGRANLVMPDGCMSTKILVAFTWICTISLLAYLLTLSICTIIRYSTDKQVLHATVRDFPWFATCSSLASTPASPAVEKGMPFVPPNGHNRSAPTAPPQQWTPHLTVPHPTGSRHELVPTFSQPPRLYEAAPTTYKYAHNISPPGAQRTPSPPGLPPVAPVKPAPMPSLYSEHLQSSIPSSVRATVARRLEQYDHQEPPPLGSWPRRDTTDAPSSRGYVAGSSRPMYPPPAFSGRRGEEEEAPRSVPPSSSSAAPSRNHSRHPSGPRAGSAGRRPPPLNLDGISSMSRSARR